MFTGSPAFFSYTQTMGEHIQLPVFQKRLVKVLLHVACCIPSPKCTMGDVNGVSERSQQYGRLWEFSQTLSSQYGVGIFSSVFACRHCWHMIHNTFRAWYARCNKTGTNLFWNSCIYTCMLQPAPHDLWLLFLMSCAFWQCRYSYFVFLLLLRTYSRIEKDKSTIKYF